MMGKNVVLKGRAADLFREMTENLKKLGMVGDGKAKPKKRIHLSKSQLAKLDREARAILGRGPRV